MTAPIPSRRWLGIACGLAVVALAGLLRPGALGTLLALDALWLAALGVDAWLAAGSYPIEVKREAPPAFSVGRAFPVRYRWRHGRSRALAVLVQEALPPPLGWSSGARRLQLAPGVTTTEELSVRPVARGKGAGGGLDLRVLGPLGLAWWQRQVRLPWEATVFPTLTGASLRALPPQTRRRRQAGLRNVRRPGAGRLFEGLREWVPGDDTRIIDWKATARRGKPIARQYEEERREHLIIVIDAGRQLTAEVDGVARLESVVNAAVRLAHAGVEHDDDVGVMIFADQVQSFVPAARGRRGLRGVLEALAAAEGRLVEPDYPAAFRYLAARNRRRALTVFFTDIIDRTASEAMVAQVTALRARHVPLAVTLRDPALERLASGRPATEAAAFERAAAEELLLAREDALAEMRRRGILVLDVAPGSAADAVVERYHQLKRRGVV